MAMLVHCQLGHAASALCSRRSSRAASLSCLPPLPPAAPRPFIPTLPCTCHLPSTSYTHLQQRGPASRTAIKTRSFFDALEDAVTVAAIGGSILGIAYSAVISSAAALGKRSQQQQGGQEDNFAWGLMGVISFFPLFNWMAWVLAALQGERSTLYYTYAAIYALPFLTEGFDIDKFSVAMLLLGIVHVQVERIAQTEPATLQSLRPLSVLAGVIRGAAGGSATYLSSVTKDVAADARQAAEARRTQRSKELTSGAVDERSGNARPWAQGLSDVGVSDAGSSTEEEYERAELMRFDSELQERERQRRRNLLQQQQQHEKNNDDRR